MPFLIVTYFLLAIYVIAPSPVRANEECGEPPPVANENLRSDIEGRVHLLSRLVGGGELGGAVESSRKEIFSRYPDAEKTRSNAYMEYMVCTLIMNDKKLSTSEKLDELIRVRLAFKEPSAPPKLSTRNINTGVKQFSLVDDETIFLFEGRHWFTFEHGRTANAGCIRVVLDGKRRTHCVGRIIDIKEEDRTCGIIYLGMRDGSPIADFTLRCQD